MATITSEIIWLRVLLKDLNFCVSKWTKLLCDNQVIIHIASNLVFHEQAKHIEISCHFEKNVQVNILYIPFTHSDQQLANIFTKSLTTSRFEEILSKSAFGNIFTQSASNESLFSESVFRIIID